MTAPHDPAPLDVAAHALPATGDAFVAALRADPAFRLEGARFVRAKAAFDAHTAEVWAWLMDGYTPDAAGLRAVRDLWAHEQALYERLDLAQQDLRDASLDFLAALEDSLPPERAP